MKDSITLSKQDVDNLIATIEHLLIPVQMTGKYLGKRAIAKRLRDQAGIAYTQRKDIEANVLRDAARDIEEICEEIRERYDAHERDKTARLWRIIYDMLRPGNPMRLPATKAGEYIMECSQKIAENQSSSE